MIQAAVKGRRLVPSNQFTVARPRLNKLLAMAIENPLVTVTASAGYGKTRAVYDFLEQYDAEVVWVQLSASDNSEEHFWENYVSAVRAANPLMADQLADIHFPHSQHSYDCYNKIAEACTAANRHHVIVYDDLHQVSNRNILDFIERRIFDCSDNFTVLLISRSDPDISFGHLELRGLAFNINEDDLRFSTEEINELLNHHQVSLTPEQFRELYEETEGWAIAVAMAANAFKANPRAKNAIRNSALSYIGNVLEREILAKQSLEMRHFLIAISLVGYLDATLAREIAQTPKLFEQLGELAAVIRYDRYMNVYRIHHLFVELLRQKRDELAPEAVKRVYLKAAKYYENSGQLMEALDYYSKAADYQAVLTIIRNYPQQQIPASAARIMLDILEAAPKTALDGLAQYYVVHNRLLMSLGRIDEAVANANACIQCFSNKDMDKFATTVLSGAYLVLGIANFMTAPYTNDYNFDVYLAKASKYRMINPFARARALKQQNISTWATMVGYPRAELFDEYLQHLKNAVAQVSQAMHGAMAGLDDLAAAEVAYYKGELKAAEASLQHCLQVAAVHKQHETLNRARLLLMRLEIATGTAERLNETLAELATQLDSKDYSMRFVTHDTAMSWYYAIVGQAQSAPDWLKSGIKESDLPYYLAIYATTAQQRLLYSQGNYVLLLALLERRRNSQFVIFDKLESEIMEALCKYKLGDKTAAFASLASAYALAMNGELMMPFAEFGKDMRSLCIAAIKADAGAAATAEASATRIPVSWLEEVRNKAATYAKNLNHIIEQSNQGQPGNACNGASLSVREREILSDLYRGLSRAEIATNRGLSINTVKSALKHIYQKLGASNSSDAIRIATIKELV